MKALLSGLVFAVVLVACGDNEVYTWGDASLEMGPVFCGALSDCGYDVDLELCIEHTAWHLCEPDYSCDVEVDEVEAEDAIAACDIAFREFTDDPNSLGCYFLRYGITPEGCMDFWDMSPGPQADH